MADRVRPYIDYYRRCREIFLKPPETPNHFNTPVKWGCPAACGLCTDHEQRSCLTLTEITDFCNLRCPVCYASNGPDRHRHRDLATVERMREAVVRNEGKPDVLQISGGEPTLDPQAPFSVLNDVKIMYDWIHLSPKSTGGVAGIGRLGVFGLIVGLHDL